MDSSARENLKETHVKAALASNKGTRARLISWAIDDFPKRGGDHYIGVVTCVKVKYVICEKEHNDTYVVKVIAPPSMKALRDMVSQGCKKELMFYKELLPALNAELKALGLGPLRTPECLHMNFDPDKPVLLLTDLRSRGFRALDGRKCLDEKHTSLILQELARFHAASHLLMAKMGRVSFDVQFSFLEKEWYNVTDDAVAFFKTLYDGNIENAIAILQRLGADDRAIKWLKKIKPDVYEILEGLMKRDSVFTTVCHADCLSNNVLFRYNDDGKPMEVTLLDFQLVRQASLVTDLNLLLYICLYGSDRLKHTEGFLQTYFTSFKNVIDASTRAMPFNFQELSREYKNKNLFGVIWAMSVVPMFTSGDELSASTKENKTSDCAGATSAEERKDTDSTITGKHSELSARFMPIFEEMIERGIIS